MHTKKAYLGVTPIEDNTENGQIFQMRRIISCTLTLNAWQQHLMLFSKQTLLYIEKLCYNILNGGVGVLSMTGFGRSVVSCDGREITMEIKSVNHRFLDIAIRAPRVLGFSEEEIKKRINRYISRGHLEVSVQYKNTREDNKTVSVDEGLAKEYLSVFNTLRQLGASGEPDLKLLARMNDVLTVTYAEEDRPAVLELVYAAVDEACGQIINMRRVEGEKILRDMLLKLDTVQELAGQIKLLSEGAAEEYGQKLRRRLEEILEDAAVDEQRLAQEIAIMADRLAIDEELVRLDAHLSSMRDNIAQQGPLGRRLDFILQEINREVNTIGSKAMDAGIQSRVVDIKGELEKLREQVQNIE